MNVGNSGGRVRRRFLRRGGLLRRPDAGRRREASGQDDQLVVAEVARNDRQKAVDEGVVDRQSIRAEAVDDGVEEDANVARTSVELLQRLLQLGARRFVVDVPGDFTSDIAAGTSCDQTAKEEDSTPTSRGRRSDCRRRSCRPLPRPDLQPPR